MKIFVNSWTCLIVVKIACKPSNPASLGTWSNKSCTHLGKSASRKVSVIALAAYLVNSAKALVESLVLVLKLDKAPSIAKLPVAFLPLALNATVIESKASLLKDLRTGLTAESKPSAKPLVAVSKVSEPRLEKSSKPALPKFWITPDRVVLSCGLEPVPSWFAV